MKNDKYWLRGEKCLLHMSEVTVFCVAYGKFLPTWLRVGVGLWRLVKVRWKGQGGVQGFAEGGQKVD